MYCEKCKRVFDGAGRCPHCGSRRTRPPLPEDLCFLTETDPMFGGMLRDVLAQGRIPAVASSAMGAGMALKVGPMFDQTRFYVPCEYLPAAKELVASLFQAPDAPEPETDEEIDS